MRQFLSSVIQAVKHGPMKQCLQCDEEKDVKSSTMTRSGWRESAVVGVKQSGCNGNLSDWQYMERYSIFSKDHNLVCTLEG